MYYYLFNFGTFSAPYWRGYLLKLITATSTHLTLAIVEDDILAFFTFLLAVPE